MLFERGHGAGVHVAARADLEVQSLAARDLHPLARLRGRLAAHDVDAVADARGAEARGLEHAVAAVRLARVAGEPEAAVERDLHRFGVVARREVALGAREVETDHASGAVANRAH